jgi:hypothetical protein
MYRVWILLVVTLSFSCKFTAQSTPTPQVLTFQVLASQPWTDTGLDLQVGDIVKISAISFTDADNSGAPACNANGLSAAVSHSSLPLPSAAAGALIAKLDPHGATTLLVGANRELHVEESSRLFLGLNSAGTPLCEGGFTVHVQKISANKSTDGTSAEQSRADRLKSQLGTAAQRHRKVRIG